MSRSYTSSPTSTSVTSRGTALAFCCTSLLLHRYFETPAFCVRFTVALAIIMWCRHKKLFEIVASGTTLTEVFRAFPQL
jgi:hypothetical protein